MDWLEGILIVNIKKDIKTQPKKNRQTNKQSFSTKINIIDKTATPWRKNNHKHRYSYILSNDIWSQGKW